MCVFKIFDVQNNTNGNNIIEIKWSSVFFFKKDHLLKKRDMSLQRNHITLLIF